MRSSLAVLFLFFCRSHQFKAASCACLVTYQAKASSLARRGAWSAQPCWKRETKRWEVREASGPSFINNKTWLNSLLLSMFVTFFRDEEKLQPPRQQSRQPGEQSARQRRLRLRHLRHPIGVLGRVRDGGRGNAGHAALRLAPAGREALQDPHSAEKNHSNEQTGQGTQAIVAWGNESSAPRCRLHPGRRKRTLEKS